MTGVPGYCGSGRASRWSGIRQTVQSTTDRKGSRSTSKNASRANAKDLRENHTDGEYKRGPYVGQCSYV